MEKDQVWADTEFRFAYIEFEVSGCGLLFGDRFGNPQQRHGA